MKSTTILVFFSAVSAASATSVTFTFDTQTINGTKITGLSSGASIAQIQTYMNAVLSAGGCTGCTVAVAGAAADQTYNGDGHVTGPGTGSKSLTLGASEDATASNWDSTLDTTYDTFLANTNDSSVQQANQITMKFSGFTINGAASFDYEIFPDGSCPALNAASCGGPPAGGIFPNQPDLAFEAGTNSNGSDPVVSSFGTNGVEYGVKPGTTNGNSNNSPDSQTEKAPQYIGTWSGSLSNVDELDFVDWPATVGVDNLSVSWNTSQSAVPDPSSVILLGTVAAGMALLKKLRATS